MATINNINLATLCTLAENDVFECLIDNYLMDNYR